MITIIVKQNTNKKQSKHFSYPKNMNLSVRMLNAKIK